MIEVVLATSNPDKVREINAISVPLGVHFVRIDKPFDPDECGADFFENAKIKAREASLLSGSPSLADDSGLCVDALGGRPGLNSARYASTQEGKIAKILDEMKDIEKPQRTAEFVCAMVLCGKDGEVLYSTEGKCEGEITLEPSGAGGFGYDPVFYVHSAQKTMAEMSDEEKNSLSHRALALLPMLDWIKKNL